MQNRLKGVSITGIASVVPSGVKRIEEEADLFGWSDLKIKRLKRDVGINKRHIALPRL